MVMSHIPREIQALIMTAIDTQPGLRTSSRVQGISDLALNVFRVLFSGAAME
jgi:hypothetical protein